MTLQPFGIAVSLGILAELVAGVVLLWFATTKVRAAHPRAAGLLAAAATMHLIALTLGCLYIARPFQSTSADGGSSLVILDALAITHPITRALSLALVAAAALVWARDRNQGRG